MPILLTLVPSAAHSLEGHPENKGRFSHFQRLESLPFYPQLQWHEAVPASLDEVARVHSPAMITNLQELSQRGLQAIDASPTYLTTGSWQSAMTAAGGALGITRAILHHSLDQNADLPRSNPHGLAQKGFALVRPPGHHAGISQPGGFCLLNNIAIAAADALSQGLNRVAIIDFDGHHGNGTQQIFLNDDRVAFFSCHQQGGYPGSGAMNEAPDARGRILNLPLPAHAGDEALKLIAEAVLWPWVESFKPEMLFISAGFDGHWFDPLLNLGFSSLGFFSYTRQLIAMADRFSNGRIIFVLEGGYNPPILVECVAAVLSAMMEENQPTWPGGSSAFLEPDIRSRVARLQALHHLTTA